jgi:hypothetical protein
MIRTRKPKESTVTMMPYYRANLIRRVMGANEITVKALVELTKKIDPKGQGVSDVSISRIRAGRPIDMKKIRLVSDALKIDWPELFNFQADEAAPLAQAG